LFLSGWRYRNKTDMSWGFGGRWRRMKKMQLYNNLERERKKQKVRRKRVVGSKISIGKKRQGLKKHHQERERRQRKPLT